MSKSRDLIEAGAQTTTLASAMQAIVKRWRTVVMRYRQRRIETNVREALEALDDRALHDLGFDRSEIMSVAAEASGEAEGSRVRLLPAEREVKCDGAARPRRRGNELLRRPGVLEVMSA